MSKHIKPDRWAKSIDRADRRHVVDRLGTHTAIGPCSAELCKELVQIVRDEYPRQWGSPINVGWPETLGASRTIGQWDDSPVDQRSDVPDDIASFAYEVVERVVDSLKAWEFEELIFDLYDLAVQYDGAIVALRVALSDLIWEAEQDYARKAVKV